MYRGIYAFHPFVSLLYYIGATALVMLYKHPVFLLVGVIALIVVNLLLDKGKSLKNWVVMILFLAFIFLIINPFVNHRGTHILFYFHQNPIMLEAVIQGLISALTILTMMALFTTLPLIMSSDKFLFLFSRWLPKWTLLTMLSMRFVPLLRRRLREIEIVQKGKGLSVTEGKLVSRAKSGILLVQILLTWSLEEAIQTADSMTARGYGIRKRSKYTPYKMTTIDWLAVMYLCSITALGFVGWWLGDGVLSIYPILETMVMEGREWFFLFIFIAFIGSPIVIEGREVLIWHFWKRNK